MTTKTKKIIILSIFAKTELDELFIESANMFGYADYFTNLIDLDDMTDQEVDTCYNRVCDICMNIAPEKFNKIKKLSLDLAN